MFPSPPQYERKNNTGTALTCPSCGINFSFHGFKCPRWEILSSRRHSGVSMTSPGFMLTYFWELWCFLPLQMSPENLDKGLESQSPVGSALSWGQREEHFHIILVCHPQWQTTSPGCIKSAISFSERTALHMSGYDVESLSGRRVCVQGSPFCFA